MSAWLIVVAVGAGTYISRLSFIGAFGSRRLPPVAEQALAYIAPAVFAALVLPAVLLRDASVDVAPATNPRLLAAALAALVAWRSKSVVAVFAVGMGALWILDYVT